MEIIDAILLILNFAPDGIRGKTAIQKIAYFVSIKTDIDMNFFAHYYGPYSREVAATLQSLSDFDFIDKEVKFTRRNRFMHVFNLNEDGKAIIEDIIKNHPKEYSIIKDTVEKIEPFGQNYDILSWAAKIYYVLNEQGRPITEHEVIKLANRHDWDLNSDQIESAKKLLLSLNLVKIKEK